MCKNLHVAQPEVGINISLSDESDIIECSVFCLTRIIQSLYYAAVGRYINPRPAIVPIEGAVLFELCFAKPITALMDD